MTQTPLLEDLPILGTTFTEFLELIRISLEGLEKDITLLQESFDINTAEGSDLEFIGRTFNVDRKQNESDANYRNRIIDFLVDYVERAIIIDGIDIIAQDIMGISPDVKEYPAFDFTNLTGQSYPGVLIDFSSSEILADLENFKEFRRIVLDYKPAGVPYFIGAIEYFTELITSIIDMGSPLSIKIGLIEQLRSGWDIDLWDQATWNGYFIDTFNFPIFGLNFTELLTTFNDTIAKNGTLNFSEQIIANDIVMQLIGDIFIKVILSISEFQFSDTFSGNIKGLFSELISSFQDSMLIDIVLEKSELISSLLDSKFKFAIKFSELMNVINDTIAKNGILKFTDTPFTGSTVETKAYRNPTGWDSVISCKSLKVGSGTVGSTGGLVVGESGGEGWDNALWDTDPCEYTQLLEDVYS